MKTYKPDLTGANRGNRESKNLRYLRFLLLKAFGVAGFMLAAVPVAQALERPGVAFKIFQFPSDQIPRTNSWEVLLTAKGRITSLENGTIPKIPLEVWQAVR